ncbi:MAG: hypothetical protein Q7K55_02230 [Candidatus Levybacteria bacterium]|nr:hypothetical protein [Candidatus Levybacteria bacterium]
MSKRKKTRHQKIISDLRRKLNTEDLSSAPQILAVKHQNSKEQKYETPRQTISLSKEFALKNYHGTQQSKTARVNPYLLQDLKKTGILTGAIIIAQIVLLFLLKVT